LRLYGQQTSGQVVASRTSSHSFAELTRLLDNVEMDSTIEPDLQQAAWVVVAMRDVSSTRAESRALSRLLSERPDLIRDKKIVVFAFGAPYYLDATDLTKISAYYALYSKAPAFIDVAARILFQELPANGASPVSVDGAGYSITRVVSPEPAQVIAISLDLPTQEASTTGTPVPTEVPTFKVGDTLPLRTGVILDHNRRPVPDGTIVQFLFTTGRDNAVVQQISSTTLDGVARASFRIQNPGIVEIRVVSPPALTSQILTLDVSGEQPAAVTAIVPTLPVKPTITRAPTLSPTPMVTPSPEPVQTATGGLLDWVLAVVLAWACAGGVYTLARPQFTLRWGLRWALLSASGGLLTYSIVKLFWAGSQTWITETLGGTIVLVLVGAVLGLALGFYWQQKALVTGKRTRS